MDKTSGTILIGAVATIIALFIMNKMDILE